MKSRMVGSMVVSNLGALVILIGSIAVGHAAIVKFEAESASPLGSDFTTGNDSGTIYITTTVNTTGTSPGSSTRVATYSVTFPEAGTYDLYGRVYVGPGGGSDDSFFFGNGFGSKSPTTPGDWVQINNINGIGFTMPSSVVTGGGSAGAQVWKWLNLSDYSGTNFTVTPGNETQTFQIGSREDGLRLDALVFGSASLSFTVAELDAGASAPPVPRDLVNGNLIQFNDNGNWSWYMDERSVVDAAGGKLVVGSDGNGSGVGGSTRSGAIEAVLFDLATRTSQPFTVMASGTLGQDDHNAPGLMVRPDGKYLAQWTGHNQTYFSYFSIFDGTNWNPYTTFDWQTLGAVNGEQASYSNPHYLSAENRAFTLVRSLDIRAMNILVSSNYGDTWSYYGKLNRRYPNSGYNPGYYRFCDNGVDRIDFICTERHPRDAIQTNTYLRFTSIYHGYISNGMSFKTDGTVVDSNLNDTNAPLSSDFTLVFSNETVMPTGQTNYRCWNSDVQRYADGTIEAIIHARINQFEHIGGYPDQEDPNHAFFFCRYDGTNWSSSYLCQAGHKLYSDEADYVGLGCLSPNDPNTIYISTQYDPRAVQSGVFDTNQPYSSAHEIWKGVTADHGASFTWTPVTQNSVRDNLRPLIPRWDADHTALIWFRGTYNTAQIIDAAVVGIVTDSSESIGVMTYVDATNSNTTLTNGSPMTPTGPDANPGADDDQWHWRSGFGNGGSVLTSSETGNGEDAPALKTSVSGLGTGTYDVWVNFWASPTSDWRIKAGLSAGGMQIFRSMASREVEPGDHSPSIVTTNADGTYLYQAYVGRVTNTSFEVFIDDYAIQTGTVSTSIGDTARTWYDGLSYARVEQVSAPVLITQTSYLASDPGNEGNPSFTLTWQSVSNATYSVVRKESLDGTDWTVLTNGLSSGGDTTTYTDGTVAGVGSAYYRIRWP